ncbi:MAG TPA: molybdopterin-dependent oxidoreductase [Planctomycetota bacterium]|nr:molybdopterin-dependent oxidoreductase [Planctomycetota bacterium]
MPSIKLNGKDIEVDGKEKLLKICLDQGAFVPHYCWHPGLQPAGNCRMCLVKVSNSRKLEVSCMYPVADKLEVSTEGPEIDAGRKQVLEFLLINHPLDCPICDKAGECDLQDYTYKYRQGVSRFEEDKNIRHTKDLGPNIRIWGNRCIVCTRCVRFCEEITGTGELCVIDRGDRSVVDVFPGIPIDNPLSLNVVDLCPVGALIDKNFMYSARVWFTQRTESVCASCSRGCNIDVTVLDNDIKRLQPRPNAEVNQYWMCDEGRLNTAYVGSERRLTKATGAPVEVAESGRRLRFAGILSTYSTIEEMYLFKKLMEALKAGPIGVLTHSRGERQKFPGGFVIEADKTPNRAYAAKLFGESTVAGGIASVVQELQAGTVEGLLVMNGIPDVTLPADLVEAAKKASFLAVCDILQNPLAELAHVVIPATAWAEKEGSFMNVDGRVQRIHKAVEPPVTARSESRWLQEVLVALQVRPAVLSTEGVFREALPDWTYGKIGTLGVKTNGSPV